MNTRDITKNTIIRMLETLVDRLGYILKTTEPEKGSPIIQCKHYRGKTHLYLRDSQGNEKYLSPSKDDEIRMIAQRQYISEVVKVAEKEKAQIGRCLRTLEKAADIDGVYNGLPDALKPYVVPQSLSDEDYASSWQEANDVVKKKRIHKEDDYHKFKTIRGDYVGSKSEAIIADRLFANGIPYHYEVAFIPEVEIDRSKPVFDVYGRLVGFEAPGFDPYSRDTLHPDFYVLNKRTRKAYYWEHLGKLDDPKYCTENLNRFVRILDAGYKIGEEILITHEESNRPLRLESIDEIIEKYLK